MLKNRFNQEYIEKVKEVAMAYILEYGYVDAINASDKDISDEDDNDFALNVFYEIVGLNYDKDSLLGLVKDNKNFLEYKEYERNGMANFIKD